MNLLELQKIIYSISSLKKGWDGYDAEPIHSDVIYNAIELSESLYDVFLNLSISPCADNSILWVWKKDNRTCLLKISDSRKCSFNVKNEFFELNYYGDFESVAPVIEPILNLYFMEPEKYES